MSIVETILECLKCKTLVMIQQLMIIIAIILVIANSYTNWMFYLDVVSMKPGLVYGYIEFNTVISLFVFSVISTILHMIEFALLSYKLKHLKQTNCNFNSFFIILTWLDVIPHMILNAIIAACHEYTVSYYQLIRNFVNLILFVIRFIVNSYEYCNKIYGSKDAEDKTEKAVVSNTNTGKSNKTKSILKKKCSIKPFLYLSNIIGFVVQLILGILILQFTFTQTYKGYLEFKTPHNTFLDHSRYFHSVNIYFSMQNFNREIYKNKWINLMSLYQPIYLQRYNMKSVVEIGLYSKVGNNNNSSSQSSYLIKFEKRYYNSKGSFKFKYRCYNTTSLFLSTMTKQNNCSVNDSNYKPIKIFLIKIKYESPDEFSQFGRVYYKGYKKNGKKKVAKTRLFLKYFVNNINNITKTNSGSMDTLLRSFNSTWHFFRVPVDIKSTKTRWKTGFQMCPSNAPDHPLYQK